MFGVFVFPRIMGKLRYRQVGAPVVLSSFDELSEVAFYPLIHAFCLSISTRVICGAEVLLYFQRFADRSGEVRCKSGISI